MKLHALSLLALLGSLGCVDGGVDEVTVVQVAEPDVDIYALYRGAPEIARDAAFELDVESCAYSRTTIAVPRNGKAFALMQSTTDGRCVVWLGMERATGLFAPHQVCVVNRDGGLPIGARPAAEDQIELFTTHPRCNLHYLPLKSLAPYVLVHGSTFDVDLAACEFATISQQNGGQGQGAWYVLTRPSDTGNRCDVWTWYFGDTGLSDPRHCRFERSGSVTAQLDGRLRIEIAGTACTGDLESR